MSWANEYNPYGRDRNRFESYADFEQRVQSDYETHQGEETKRREYERAVSPHDDEERN